MAEEHGVYWCMVKVDFTDPSREADFNDWYNNIHLPELLQLPGFLRGWRLQVTEERGALGDPGQTYIAVYELENLEAWDNPRLKQTPWDGKWGPYISNWSRVFYKVLSP